MEPILIDIPERLETPRLVLRFPRPGDGAMINEAIRETLDALQQWMAWSRPTPTPEQTELWCRKAAAVLERRSLPMLLLDRATGAYVGGSGFHEPDWNARAFETGYWLRRTRTGKGYATEAVEGLTHYAFEHLRARRLTIRCDVQNQRSRGVAERAGYELEGILRNDSLTLDGEPRSTSVYSRIA